MEAKLALLRSASVNEVTLAPDYSRPHGHIAFIGRRPVGLPGHDRPIRELDLRGIQEAPAVFCSTMILTTILIRFLDQ